MARINVIDFDSLFKQNGRIVDMYFSDDGLLVEYDNLLDTVLHELYERYGVDESSYDNFIELVTSLLQQLMKTTKVYDIKMCNDREIYIRLFNKAINEEDMHLSNLLEYLKSKLEEE